MQETLAVDSQLQQFWQLIAFHEYHTHAEVSMLFHECQRAVAVNLAGCKATGWLRDRLRPLKLEAKHYKATGRLEDGIIFQLTVEAINAATGSYITKDFEACQLMPKPVDPASIAGSAGLARESMDHTAAIMTELGWQLGHMCKQAKTGSVMATAFEIKSWSAGIVHLDDGKGGKHTEPLESFQARQWAIVKHTEAEWVSFTAGKFAATEDSEDFQSLLIKAGCVHGLQEAATKQSNSDALKVNVTGTRCAAALKDLPKGALVLAPISTKFSSRSCL